MKYKRSEIIALFNASKSGKSFVLVIEGKMFILSKALYEMVKGKEVNDVEFVEDGTLEMESGEVTTYKVKSFTDSERVSLKDTIEIAELKESAKKLGIKL